MTVLRRSIRNMMDASLDLTGTEKLRSSDNTGWTTQVGNYYQSNQSTAYTGYNTFGDATLMLVEILILNFHIRME